MNVDKRMIKARSALVLQQPFWGVLALQMELVEDPSIETMDTNGSRIRYNPAFLDELTERKTIGVIAHNVSHCAHKHHVRRGQRDKKLWNEACDYAINPSLIAAGFELHDDCLLDPQYKGMAAEEIYAILAAQPQGSPKPQQGQGQGGGGKPQPQGQKAPLNPENGRSGEPETGDKGELGEADQDGQGEPQNGSPDPGRCGAVEDAAPAHEPAELASQGEEWDRRVRQAMMVEARRAGELSAEMARTFQAMNQEPPDCWETLRRFVDDRHQTDYSWTRPNRRLMGMGYSLPGLVADGVGKVAVVVDTSCSINQPILDRFGHSMQSMMDEGLVDSIVVVYCDAKVKSYQEFTKGELLKLEPKGGGGTRFAPAIDWVLDNHLEVKALIYFTDLDCNDFGYEPPFPVLWAAYGNANTIRSKTVPFGEVVILL